MPFASPTGHSADRIAVLSEEVDDAERRVRDAGGARSDLLQLRKNDPAHAQTRSMLALELRRRRARKRLMHRHDVLNLEERGNDLLSSKSDALRTLLLTPAMDREGMLLKLRFGYEDILRHEDHDGIVRAIFADVERLCA